MNRLRLASFVTLAAIGLGCAGLAGAADDYRHPNPGPAARAESSIKHGARRAGTAIKHGAEKVGHAIGTGMRKTGELIGRGGEKVQDATAPKR